MSRDRMDSIRAGLRARQDAEREKKARADEHARELERRSVEAAAAFPAQQMLAQRAVEATNAEIDELGVRLQLEMSPQAGLLGSAIVRVIEEGKDFAAYIPSELRISFHKQGLVEVELHGSGVGKVGDCNISSVTEDRWSDWLHTLLEAFLARKR